MEEQIGLRGVSSGGVFEGEPLGAVDPSAASYILERKFSKSFCELVRCSGLIGQTLSLE